jgi:hypothetical protein
VQTIQIAVKAQAANGREKIATVATEMNPEELEIPAKRPSILAPPKETDIKQVDLGTGDPSKTATIMPTSLKNRNLCSQTFSGTTKIIFSWKLADKPGVPKELAKHRININEGSKPVKQ